MKHAPERSLITRGGTNWSLTRRRQRLNSARTARAIAAAAPPGSRRALGEPSAGVTVRIVGAAGRALNRDFRGRDYATNVLDLSLRRRRTRQYSRRHRAVRAGGAPRSARAGQGAAGAFRTPGRCTACCTCRATTTSAPRPRAWKRWNERFGRLGLPTPMREAR